MSDIQAVILVSYAVLLFVFFSLFIRFYEEPRLARAFGSDYAAYVSRVPRWLPWRLGSPQPARHLP